MEFLYEIVQKYPGNGVGSFKLRSLENECEKFENETMYLFLWVQNSELCILEQTSQVQKQSRVERSIEFKFVVGCLEHWQQQIFVSLDVVVVVPVLTQKTKYLLSKRLKQIKSYMSLFRNTGVDGTLQHIFLEFCNIYGNPRNVFKTVP